MEKLKSNSETNMTERLSLKLSGQAKQRWLQFELADENHNQTMSRLLDQAGVPIVLSCEECGTKGMNAHAKTESGTVLCLDCAGIDRNQLG